MTFRSVQGVRLPDLKDGTTIRDICEGPEGTWAWGEVEYQVPYIKPGEPGQCVCRAIYIHVPYIGPDPTYGPLHILMVYLSGTPAPPQKTAWEWDGDEQNPTLSPSIACGMPKGSDWHGHMKAGLLEACK